MASILLEQLNPKKWLVPTVCVACERRSSQQLCPRCHEGLIRFQRPQALALREPIRVWAWAQYAGDVERALHQIKYEGTYEWGGILGELMAHWWLALPDRQPDRTPWQVVPIPLSQERMQERGYNQAEEVSNTFARWTRLPHRPLWLERVRATQAQFSLNPSERAANIKGAFQARTQVSGQDILILDDICTTGSTLQEAALVLKTAGARQVAALVVARPQERKGAAVRKDRPVAKS